VGASAETVRSCRVGFDAVEDVVYNFGPFCLSVCRMITVEGLEVGSSYLHIRCMSREYIRVKFVYEGHRVKVKVTEAKKG